MPASIHTYPSDHAFLLKVADYLRAWGHAAELEMSGGNHWYIVCPADDGGDVIAQCNGEYASVRRLPDGAWNDPDDDRFGTIRQWTDTATPDSVAVCIYEECKRGREERVSKAVQLAELAFWSTVAECFPEARWGDFDPGASAAFVDACGYAVAEWVRCNVEGGDL